MRPVVRCFDSDNPSYTLSLRISVCMNGILLNVKRFAQNIINPTEISIHGKKKCPGYYQQFPLKLKCY